jgi:hypothetical protein
MATVMVTDGLGRQVLVKEPRHTRIDVNPGRHGRGGCTPCGIPPPIDLIAPDAPMSAFLGKSDKELGIVRSQGDMKVWNKKVLRQLKGEDHRLSRQASAPSIASASRSERPSSKRTPGKAQSLPSLQSLPELQQQQTAQREQQNRKERLQRYKKQREADTVFCQERVERMKEMRDERFERHYREVMSENPLIADVVENLRDHEKDRYRVAAQMCDDWHANLFDPTQKQILHHKNPANRTLAQQQTGKKAVGFSLPEAALDPKAAPQGQFVATVVRKADPMKKQLQQFAEEEHFRWEADRVIEGDPTVTMAELKRAPGIPKFTSKPTLEPNWWDELRLQSLRYGHFAQVAEGPSAEGGNFRTIVKRGDHVPDANDGIEPAGTRRGRHHKYDIGVLRGDIRHRGESFEAKNLWGSSSGAPNQDHFTYETGFKVTDEEFPRGKKMWHDLPGMPHRSIVEHFDETRQPVYRPRGGYMDASGREAHSQPASEKAPFATG